MAALVNVNSKLFLRFCYHNQQFRCNGNNPSSIQSLGCFLFNRKYSETCPDHFDVVVVGGGVVGMATARELILRHPNLKMAVVEKESKLAFHQSGHNSGVIHAGIYYKPGTLKAKLCVEGLKLAYAYCDEKNIPYKKCGKLIVATDPTEEDRLNDLWDRGTKNNVPDLCMIEKDKIKEIEPYCKGTKALHSPHTGIVDWGLVTKSYGKDFKDKGGEVYLNYQVSGFSEAKESQYSSTVSGNEYPVIVHSKNKDIRTKYVLTCGGLYSDTLSEMSGCDPIPKIVPFRGEYLILKPEKCHLVRGNIYPVPDPKFPFLGVHFTPRMDGSVWLGPNAILAFRREGYKWTDFNLKELSDTLKFSGFRKLAQRYLVFGSQEVLKSLCIAMQVKDLQKFIPEVTVKDVERGPSGVRAQALDADGNLVDDFVFDTGSTSIGKRILHCRNAPSPGATSSLAIAKLVADKVETQFQLK